MEVVLFEDSLVEQLYPITVGRPAFGVTVGAYRLLDLAKRLGGRLSALVRPHLAEITALDYGLPAADLAAESILFLNARAVPSVSAVRQLEQRVRTGASGVVTWEGRVVAAKIDRSAAADIPLPSWSSLTAAPPADWKRLVESLALPDWDIAWPLMEYPHHVIQYHMEMIAEHLQDRIAGGNYRQLQDGLFTAENVRIGEYGTVDASQGPIVVEAGAVIGPYGFLRGPVYIGANARIIEYAAIKDMVTVGHTTKIGGEIEAAVIEPYSNKQHHGFIGHSYLGSWVNLGAGSCNSDLKNTYGRVSMEYDGKRVATGMQFLGCIIGDYSKTAVNTAVFTGKVIGVCCMVYGFVTTNVPSFTNYARVFGQISEVPVDVAAAGQQRMFVRRNVAQRPCDVQLIRDMYELTRHERRLGSEPLVL
ncbi:MAG: glucose-1-phosphate thymidylyltransferase [Thermogutta sp.]|nr:glucose-1-phosphate thymidylyltransferase [Thermogutta sp.]